jgi:hypothetical protein
MIVSKDTVRISNVRESLSVDAFKKFAKTHGGKLSDGACDALYINSLKYLSNPNEKNIYAISMTMLVVHVIESEPEDLRLVMEDPLGLAAAEIIMKHCRDYKGSIVRIENEKHKKPNEEVYLAVIKRYCTEYFDSKSKRLYTDELLDICKANDIPISAKVSIKPWVYINFDGEICPKLDDPFDETEMQEKFERFCKDVIDSGTFRKYKPLLRHMLKVQ